MERKQRLQRASGGSEQWAKSATELKRKGRFAFSSAAPPSAADLSGLLSEAASADQALLRATGAVVVDKRRNATSIKGCSVECAVLAVSEGAEFTSIAIEANASAIAAAIAALDLERGLPADCVLGSADATSDLWSDRFGMGYPEFVARIDEWAPGANLLAKRAS